MDRGYWIRYYKNNEMYDRYDDSLKYMNQLAVVVQEFIYGRDKLKTLGSEFLKCIRSFDLKLCDFMSIAARLIELSKGDFGKSNIAEVLPALPVENISIAINKGFKYGYGIDNEQLYIYSSTEGFNFSLFWTITVYARAMYTLSDSDENKKMWNNVYILAYNQMTQATPYTFLYGPDLDDYTNEAVDLMLERVKDKMEKEETIMDEEADDNDITIGVKQKVVMELLLRLMEKDGLNCKKYGNKTIVAKLLNMMTKFPLSTCKNYCTNRDLNKDSHYDEINTINSNLNKLEMSVRL